MSKPQAKLLPHPLAWSPALCLLPVCGHQQLIQFVRRDLSKLSSFAGHKLSRQTVFGEFAAEEQLRAVSRASLPDTLIGARQKVANKVLAISRTD